MTRSYQLEKTLLRSGRTSTLVWTTRACTSTSSVGREGKKEKGREGKREGGREREREGGREWIRVLLGKEWENTKLQVSFVNGSR